MEIDLRFVEEVELSPESEGHIGKYVKRLQWRKGVKVGSLSADGVDWGEWEDVPLVKDTV